jgi:hypothetical protein
MILPRPEDAKHKYQLYRLLTAILENNHLANTLYFLPIHLTPPAI